VFVPGGEPRCRVWSVRGDQPSPASLRSFDSSIPAAPSSSTSVHLTHLAHAILHRAHIQTVHCCPHRNITSAFGLFWFWISRSHCYDNTPRQHPTTVSDIFFTMQRTPSPPRRLHTPPAPMHGDAYEPFSPRRSSRVAAQRDTHIHLHPQAASPRARRDVTPTAASQRKSTARIGHFTLSPPPSPVPSPQHRSPRSTRSARALDSDPDHAASTSAVRFLSTLAPVSQPRVCIGFVRAIAGQQTLRYSTRPPIPPC
jgi:hypothetical protein